MPLQREHTKGGQERLSGVVMFVLTSKEVGWLAESWEDIYDWGKRSEEKPAHAQPFQGCWSFRAIGRH